jgi:glycosyltransferase involved in cell wall biosynthesis
MGLSVALNTALQNCRTEFVLRIDSDDFASPTRAIEQINFLRNNPSIAVVSSYAIEFDGYRKTKTYRKGPISNQNILMESKLRNPILHPTVMFRKSAILNVGGYPEIKYAQDYALWGILMTNNFNFACIPKYLTSINQDSNFYKRRGFKYFISEYYVLQFLKSISFLDHKQYYFQLFFRFFSRISPFFVRSWIYKFVRFLVLKS